MNKYEILKNDIFNKNNKDFSKCEGLWEEITEEDAFRYISESYSISVEIGDEREYLKEDAARNLLESGKLILLPLFYIREKNDKAKCPKCGNSYEGRGSLSRKDNKTHICPDCGAKEAFENWFDALSRK